MKKIFLTQLLILCCLFQITAQIKSDETANGIRTIITKNKELYSKWSSAAGFCIKYIYFIDSPKTESYIFDIGFNEGMIFFNIDSEIWFKCENGDVIKLKTINEITPYNIYSIGSNFYAHPHYEVTREQIETIINGNIQKIRFFTTKGYIDREINGYNLSINLEKLLKSIDKQKTKQSKNMDF